MNKSYIWSLPTRAFHILLMVFILAAFLTGEEDELLNYHAVLGYGVLILILFRVVWGIIGPKHSKFKDFPLSISKAKEFTKNIFDTKQKYIGHNPAASFVMVAILITIFLVIVTGALAFGIQEGKGIFSFLNDSFFRKMELFEEIHETLTGVLIALIAAHLLGVLSDKLLHPKHGTLNSIFSGYKNTENNESIRLNIFQKIVAFVFLVLFLGFLIFNLIQPKNILVASKYEPIDYMTQNELFVTECASCHTLYPSKFIA
jgi:cytochrome b